jgi:hypothetical protein
MTVVGLSSLAVTGQIGAPWLVAGALAVAASAVVDVARLTPSVRSPWANAFILVALGYAVMDYLWLSPTLLHVGAHLLIALMLTRLRHRNAREYLQLIVIVFLQMVAAAGLAAHGTFNAGFAAYLPVMVWVLVHYHLISEAERTDGGPGDPPVGLAPWTAAAALAALLAAGALFLFLPRMWLELLGVVPQKDVRLSGFSPQVQLGAIGPVKRDPTIVMRVSGPSVGAGAASLYLRGAVFDAFDGRNWLATTPARRMVPLDAEGRFALGRGADDQPSMAVRAEPLDTPVLFTPERTEAVLGPFAAVLVDDDGIFNLPYPSGVRQTYDVWRRSPTASRPAVATVDPRFLRRIGSPRVAELAAQAAARASTPRDQALAVERFLRTRYDYTLDVPGGEDRPVETFLFDRRSGYCEHFASAMALMLRTLGIPTRLVTGFLVQEWNPFGDYAIVRQGDAHAWVEAFLPESGWTRFDPTPPAPLADRPWTGRIEQYLDSLRTGWDRYVLDFSLGDQHAAIERAEAGWERLRARVVGGLGAARQRVARVTDAAWLIGGLAVLAVCGLVGARRGRWWPVLRRPTSEDASIAFYQRLLHLLERRGLQKPSAATPLEFAVQQTSRVAYSAAIRRVTDRYYEVRYGHRRLSPAERRAVEADLAAIEREGQPS